MQRTPFDHPRLAQRWGGYVPTAPDPRDFTLPHLNLRGWEVLQAGPQAASASRDLRDYQGQSLMVPGRDQEQIGSCTGEAWAYMRAAATARYHVDRGEVADLGDDLSARFIYDLERHMTGDYPQDTGAAMQAGGAVLAKYGCSPERFCPYTGRADNGPINTEITEEALGAALAYGISTYYRIPGTGQQLLNGIIGCVDEGWPCVIAILVPGTGGSSSFEQVPNSGEHAGWVPMPQRGENVLGGHALCVCGYYLDDRFAGGVALLFLNSWSRRWGQNGYGFLPGAYFTTSSGQYGTWGQEALTLR